MSEPEPQGGEGFAAIPNWLVRDESVSGNAKLVYMCLMARTSRTATAWPSHARIARESGMSVSTVKVALAELKKLGVVSWRPQITESGGRSSNMYSILTQLPPSQ